MGGNNRLLQFCRSWSGRLHSNIALPAKFWEVLQLKHAGLILCVNNAVAQVVIFLNCKVFIYDHKNETFLAFLIWAGAMGIFGTYFQTSISWLIYFLEETSIASVSGQSPIVGILSEFSVSFAVDLRRSILLMAKGLKSIADQNEILEYDFDVFYNE